MLAAGPILAQDAANHVTAKEDTAGWIQLFDGKSLNGWEGDTDLWSVKDGTIVGSTQGHPLKVNTFLVYNQSYSDFILKADILLRNGNSGIQFRSVLKNPGWLMEGYQADASEAGDLSAWGNLYENGGRARRIMRTSDEGWQVAKKVVKVGGWNQIEIFAQGTHIQLKLNGTVTIDMHDDRSASGLIGFQLHPGPPMEVRYRNIRLKLL